MPKLNRRNFFQSFLAFIGLGGLNTMTQKSWPWSGTAVGDATLAPYTNKFFADMFQLLNVYDRTTMGVVDTGHASYPGGLLVNPGAGFVTVQSGVGVSDGMWLTNDAAVNLTPDDTPTLRTDLVVIQKDVTAQTARLVLLKGTDGSAVPPSLTQSLAIWEIPLAEVPITAGPTIGAVVNVAVAVRSALAPGYQFNMLDGDDLTFTVAAWNLLTGATPCQFSLGPGKWMLWGTAFIERNANAGTRGLRLYDNTLGATMAQGGLALDTAGTIQGTIAVGPVVVDLGVVTQVQLQFYAIEINDVVYGGTAGSGLLDTKTTMMTAIRVV